jgi:Domain of unknown function (DUF4424)
MRTLLAGNLVLIALGAVAAAQPATRELATGGLAFIDNRAIELRALNAFVSLKEIRIDYRLANTSGNPVTVRAFVPIPEVRVGRDDVPAVPTDNPDNIFDLTATADGRPIAVTIERRALAGGVDNVEYLGNLGIPLAPHFPATNDALDRLPREQWPELAALGLAEIVQQDDAQGVRPHLQARWGLQTILSFQHTFAPQSETLLQLRYKPSVGVSVQTALGTAGATDEAWFKDYEERYCIDNDLVVSVERRRGIAKATAGAPFSEARIDLSKALADWGGPVKDLRVVLDKGETTSFVSICAEGVKKIAPTQFEFQVERGLSHDLDVLILRRLPPTR